MPVAAELNVLKVRDLLRTVSSKLGVYYSIINTKRGRMEDYEVEANAYVKLLEETKLYIDELIPVWKAYEANVITSDKNEKDFIEKKKELIGRSKSLDL